MTVEIVLQVFGAILFFEGIAFSIFYTRRFKWWKSELGVYLMAIAFSIELLGLWVVLPYTWLYITTLVMLVLAFGWRIRIFIVYSKRGFVG